MLVHLCTEYKCTRVHADINAQMRIFLQMCVYYYSLHRHHPHLTSINPDHSLL